MVYRMGKILILTLTVVRSKSNLSLTAIVQNEGGTCFLVM